MDGKIAIAQYHPPQSANRTRLARRQHAFVYIQTVEQPCGDDTKDCRQWEK
jgi:hypothetical protein